MNSFASTFVPYTFNHMAYPEPLISWEQRRATDCANMRHLFAQNGQFSASLFVARQQYDEAVKKLNAARHTHQAQKLIPGQRNFKRELYHAQMVASSQVEVARRHMLDMGSQLDRNQQAFYRLVDAVFPQSAPYTPPSIPEVYAPVWANMLEVPTYQPWGPFELPYGPQHYGPYEMPMWQPSLAPANHVCGPYYGPMHQPSFKPAEHWSGPPPPQYEMRVEDFSAVELPVDGKMTPPAPESSGSSSVTAADDSTLATEHSITTSPTLIESRLDWAEEMALEDAEESDIAGTPRARSQSCPASDKPDFTAQA